MPDPGNHDRSIVSGFARVFHPAGGHSGVMASITDKIAKFARSPRGQQLVRQAQEYAARPENQRRLARLRERLAARRRPEER